ncbi:MAG: hypothetical protein PHD48_04290 [Alphaproteobacteria bacterium]|nr:hypothetical protein [Alphaproteobacteria bacterium]
MKMKAVTSLHQSLERAKAVLTNLENGITKPGGYKKSVEPLLKCLQPFSSSQKKGGDVRAAYYIGVLSLTSVCFRSDAFDAAPAFGDGHVNIDSNLLDKAEKYLKKTINWPEAPKDTMHYKAKYYLSCIYDLTEAVGSNELLGGPNRTNEIWKLREEAADAGCLEAKLSIAEGSLLGTYTPYNFNKVQSLVAEVQERKDELPPSMQGLLGEIATDLQNKKKLALAAKTGGRSFKLSPLGFGNC